MTQNLCRIFAWVITIFVGEYIASDGTLSPWKKYPLMGLAYFVFWYLLVELGGMKP